MGVREKYRFLASQTRPDQDGTRHLFDVQDHAPTNRATWPGPDNLFYKQKNSFNQLDFPLNFNITPT